MPVFRYFLYVGAALVVMLVAINAYAPQPPAPVQANGPGFDHSTIRITSNRVTEDPIVYDTNQPTIVPPRTQVAEAKPVNSGAAKNDGTATRDTRVEAMAQIDAPPKPAASKPKPKPRKIARREYPRQQYQQYAQRQAWAQQSFFPNFFGSW